MLKRDFFLKAMLAEEYKRRAWVLSAFALTREDPNAWQREPYAYRIVCTPTGFFFVDPENDNKLSQIEDAPAGIPLFNVKEKVTIVNTDGIANHQLPTPIETTYGRLLTNYMVLIYPFGNKIPYINKRMKPGMLEDLIINRLKDNPEFEHQRNSEDIYVDEYLKFTNAMFALAGFSQICVPAATRKTMTAAPGIEELKERLIKENEGHLHDPAVIAKIDAELVKYDRAYLKGDEGEGFLIKDKSFNIVRKKLFGMHGAEVGLSETVNVELIQNSLSQGWDISKFPAMNDSLRAGSFNRGANTMLGGESVKFLQRASSNIGITADDCGTRLGKVVEITPKNCLQELLGFSVITEMGSTKIASEEDAKKYIGKVVMRRSPMYCKLDKTDYCSCCVGDRLAASPKGLSSAVTETGSVFLSVFMAAGHSKGLILERMDLETAIT